MIQANNYRQSPELPLQKPQYEMHVFGSGYRRRFTIAHELAHVVLHNNFRAKEKNLTAPYVNMLQILQQA
jgi:predicted SprT family Zn-dependent metalloprotease